ncbi:hypothetical protein PPYR_12746 [Photinus pyralis]|uniref:WAP domain-containing protein n=2 Tax=Photinus pyralis TaxID=7054 RepID=A0A5N4A721_PHOPY|nr:uncharacterized protein LOC116177605 [Photinus pyralis]KAB0793126.1 hypothetical protein PPYR_12746 [Photinus pyralis]
MFPVWSVVFGLASLVLCACSGELEYPEVRYCPVVNPCQAPLLYDVKHRCGIDEACPQGYKCCKNGCYIHKVCVVPVNKNGDQIPPPTHAVTDPSDEQENEIKEWPKLSTQFTDKETGSTSITNFSHGVGITNESGQSTTITSDTTASTHFDNATEGATESLTTSSYTTMGPNEQDSTPTEVQGTFSEHSIGFTNPTNATVAQGLGNESTTSEQDSNTIIVQGTVPSSTIGDDYTSFSTLSNLIEETSQQTGVQRAGDELTSGEQDFTSTNVPEISSSSKIEDDYTSFSTLSNLIEERTQETGVQGAGDELTSGKQDFTSTNVPEISSSSKFEGDYTRFSTLPNLLKAKLQYNGIESAENELTSGQQDFTSTNAEAIAGFSTLAKTTSKQILVEDSGNELTSGETSTNGPSTTIGEDYTQTSIFDNLIKAISRHIGWEGSGDGFTSDDEDDLVDGSGEGSGITEYVSQSTTDAPHTPQTEFIDLDGGTSSFSFEEVSNNPSTWEGSGADATHFSTFTDDEDVGEGSEIQSPLTTDDDVHFPDVVTEIGTTIWNGSVEDTYEEITNSSIGVTTTINSRSESTGTSDDDIRFPDETDSPTRPSPDGSSDGSVEQTKPPSENDDITFPHESTPTENNHVKFLTSKGRELEGSGDDSNDTESDEDDDEGEETTLPTFVTTSSTNLTVKALPSHTFAVGPHDNVTYEEDDDDEDDDGVDEDIRNNFQGKTVRG